MLRPSDLRHVQLTPFEHVVAWGLALRVYNCVAAHGPAPAYGRYCCCIVPTDVSIWLSFQPHTNTPHRVPHPMT